MAMILTSDHKEGGCREEQSRNSVIKSKICNSGIDELTDEVLVNILQKVSCKSVCRCKSVSKRWFALISDPYFTHSCSRYHTNEKLWPRELAINFYPNGFLITPQHPEVGFPLNLSFLPCFQTSQLQEEACLIGSSNGLLLCCTTQDYQSIYYVCNPFTKHWAVLPPAPSSPETVLVGFICDTVSCNSTSSKCSFKVVRLSTSHEERSAFKVETFSSKTCQWTNSVVSCPRDPVQDFICNSSGLTYNGWMVSIIDFCNKTAIEYNGRLHWYIAYLYHQSQVILVYHPNDDKVTFIDCPRVRDPLLDGTPLRGPQYFNDILGVSRGCLRMSHLRKYQQQPSNEIIYCLSIWELKDYNTGKWCLEHQILINDLICNNDNCEPKPPTGRIRVLAFHPYADAMYLMFSKCCVSCDLPTKTSTFLSDYPYKFSKHRGFIKLVGFTLVLPPWPTPVPALPHDALLQ